MTPLTETAVPLDDVRQPARRVSLRWLLALAAAVASALSIACWWQERESASRRLAAWEAEQAELAASDGLERLVTLKGGKLTLEAFAELMEREVGLPVEIDFAAIEAEKNIPPRKTLFVRAPTGTLSIRSAFRLALSPLGLAADRREGQIVITTLGESAEENRLLTVVYPLPQPEPVGMDEDAWRTAVAGCARGDGRHIQAVPGGLVVVSTADGHRRVQQTIDAICGLAGPLSQPVVVPPQPPGDVERRILAELRQPAQIEFVETPLADAATYLSDRHAIPIILQEKALTEAGINLDAPVTKMLNGVSLRSALRLLLKDLDLTFDVRDEALLITTYEEAESRLHTVAYPVHDLVASAAGPDYAPLTGLVQETIAPQSWEQVGGPGGIRGISGGWLLVSQTAYTQEQVANFLAQLRAALRVDAPRGVVRVSPPSANEQKIERALARTIPLEFQGAPLKDAMQEIQDTLDIPCVINTKTLNDAGINIDTPVTCSLPPGRAGFQLQLLLEPLDLNYVVRDEVLQITTPDD
ncbi:MAG TPA: hypothetical protein VFB80_25035, partial [Pirellulaceae bacterium]|nr:hypothetical protein [Pirellulaceae bacterium]